MYRNASGSVTLKQQLTAGILLDCQLRIQNVYLRDDSDSVPNSFRYEASSSLQTIHKLKFFNAPYHVVVYF